MNDRGPGSLAEATPKPREFPLLKRQSSDRLSSADTLTLLTCHGVGKRGGSASLMYVGDDKQREAIRLQVCKVYGSVSAALAGCKKCRAGPAEHHYLLSHLRTDPKYERRMDAHWRKRYGTTRPCSGCGRSDRLLGLAWCPDCIKAALDPSKAGACENRTHQTVFEPPSWS